MKATVLKFSAGSLFALALISGCAGSKPGDVTRPPRLVVVLSIDQMRADYLTRFADRYAGGLARLTRDGVVFTDAHHGHAITETAPGHAAVSTGAYPGRTGIIANAWWDRAVHRAVYAVEDTVAITGLPGAQGSSPANLLRETLGDWLKQASPKSKVFSVALKDRAAILMAGHHADAAFWFYDPQGAYVTSASYLDAYPKWVLEFNASRLVDTYFEAGWTRLRGEDAYTASREDAFPYEADGKNTTFPHRFPGTAPGPAYYGDLQRTPFGDDLTFAFARELVRREKLGADNTPDLLFVGASAADGVGHAYGPYSQEVEDYYLRLDQMLQTFFDFLDREVGRAEYVVVLTADHGVLPLPEELQRRGVDAGRINVQRLLQPVIEQALRKRGLTGLRPILIDGLVLDLQEGAPPDTTMQALRRTLAAAFRDLDEVEDAFTLDELMDPRTPDRPFLTPYRRSFNAYRASDIILRYKEYYLPSSQATSTSHGSPYPYDTHVPIIFLGAGMPAVQYDARVHVVDIAPTLAALLNVPAPADLDGRVLAEVLSARRSGALSSLP